jgi:peptidoglycan/LPS O-acetylase OafA/YrhL
MLIAILSETPPWFARGPLVYLGRISYGLYVFHALAIVLADKMVNYLPHGQVVRGGMMITFLLTVISGALSYHFLGEPFLHMKQRFTTVPSRHAISAFSFLLRSLYNSSADTVGGVTPSSLGSLSRKWECTLIGQ